jgi:hypothetical protein
MMTDARYRMEGCKDARKNATPSGLIDLPPALDPTKVEPLRGSQSHVPRPPVLLSLCHSVTFFYFPLQFQKKR